MLCSTTALRLPSVTRQFRPCLLHSISSSQTTSPGRGMPSADASDVAVASSLRAATASSGPERRASACA